MDTVQGVLGIIISMSTVLGVFTGIINKLFSHKLKPLEDKIDLNEKKSMENDMDEWRYQCVSFASDLHKKIPKTIYEFEIIFKLADKYEQIVEELGIKNNLFDEELLYIKEEYRKLLKDNSK